MAFFCKKKIMKYKYLIKNNNKDNSEIIRIKEGYYYYKNKENNNILLKNNKTSMFLLNIIILFISLSLSRQQKLNLRNLNYDSLVTMVIRKTGEQPIIYNKFQYKPYEVTVNGIIQTPVNDYVSLEEEKDNIIVMKFNTIINSTHNMFRNIDCSSIDFSEFDFSQVTDMSFMFYECKNLESINFGNINTPSLLDMNNLFCSCQKLTSIDLSLFNTSSVKDMGSMFYQCFSL